MSQMVRCVIYVGKNIKSFFFYLFSPACFPALLRNIAWDNECSKPYEPYFIFLTMIIEKQSELLGICPSSADTKLVSNNATRFSFAIGFIISYSTLRATMRFDINSVIT